MAENPQIKECLPNGFTMAHIIADKKIAKESKQKGGKAKLTNITKKALAHRMRSLGKCFGHKRYVRVNEGLLEKTDEE